MVTSRARGRGVGRSLIEAAIEEARSLGAKDLNVNPVARNESAICAFHQLGFRTLGHLQMFIRLDPDEADWPAAMEVHGKSFRY